MTGNPTRFVLIMFFSLIAFVKSMPAAETGATITGIVKTASGQPAPGAMVSLRNAERRVTVTVVSKEKGLYKAANLVPGNYTVQALGGGFQSTPSPAIEVTGGQTSKVDATLSTPQDFRKAMTSAQVAELLPEPKEKALMVLSYCSDCHKAGLLNIFFARKDKKGWSETIQKMRNKPYGFYASLEFSDQLRDETADYLAQHFGPNVPPPDTKKYLPKTWVQDRQARRGRVVEFDLVEGAAPHDIAVDSQGIAWVSEQRFEKQNGVIGRLDPNTWTYTEIRLPGEKASPSGIAVDQQDRVWMTDTANTRLVQYDPKTRNFTMYPLRRPGNAAMIRFLSNGMVWLTNIGADLVVAVDPNTKETSEYPMPFPRADHMRVQPYGMAIDGNEMVWFAEFGNGKMGKLDPKTGKITEYDLPTGFLAKARRMGSDANGDVWVGESGDVGKLAKIDHKTMKITEYATPTKYSGPYSAEADKKHNFIWVSEWMADKLARFDPKTKTFVEFPLPTHFGKPNRIEVDPTKPNRVWFNGDLSDKAGYLDVMDEP